MQIILLASLKRRIPLGEDTSKFKRWDLRNTAKKIRLFLQIKKPNISMSSNFISKKQFSFSYPLKSHTNQTATGKICTITSSPFVDPKGSSFNLSKIMSWHFRLQFFYLFSFHTKWLMNNYLKTVTQLLSLTVWVISLEKFYAGSFSNGQMWTGSSPKENTFQTQYTITDHSFYCTQLS